MTKINFPVFVNNKDKGRIYKISITNSKSSSPYNINEDFKKSVKNSILSVRKYLDSKYNLHPIWEDDFYIEFKPKIKSSEIIKGRSAGLAAWTAYFCKVLDIDIPDNYIFTGILENTNVKPVSYINQKIKAALEKYDNPVMVVSHKEKTDKFKGIKFIKINNQEELVEKLFDKKQIKKQINKLIKAKEKKIDLQLTFENLNKIYDNKRWHLARIDYENLLYRLERKELEKHEKEYLFQCYWRSGSIATHFGDLKKIKYYFDKAQDFLNANEDHISAKSMSGFYNSKIVGYYFDFYRFKQAEQECIKTLKFIDRKEVENSVKIKVLGTYGQVLTELKKYKLAEKNLLKSLDAPEKYRSQDYIYLVNLMLKQLKLDKAEEYYGKAEKFISYITSDTSKNLQKIYNKLSKLKLIYHKKDSLKKAESCIKKIDSIYKDVIDEDLYPKGVALFYYAKILEQHNKIEKAGYYIYKAYEFLEKLDSINIDVISGCIRLYQINMMFKYKQVNIEQDFINEHIQKFDKFISRIKTIRDYYYGEFSKLKQYIKTKSKTKIISQTDKLIKMNPYI